MSAGREIMSLVSERQNLDRFRREHWLGSFQDYLDIVRENPRVTRNAFQRIFDMVMSYGVKTREVNRERIPHYVFFDDPANEGRDAVFGLDRAIADLVNAFKSAAHGYGIEKRVLLLHGPVGSSKSTIARLLKKGLERYSLTDEGALYTLGWIDGDGETMHWCPMHEEPLQLDSARVPRRRLARLNQGRQRRFSRGAQGRPLPLLPLHVCAAARAVWRRLDIVWRRMSACGG